MHRNASPDPDADQSTVEPPDPPVPGTRLTPDRPTRTMLRATITTHVPGQPAQRHELQAFTTALFGRYPRGVSSPSAHHIGLNAPWISRLHAIAEFTPRRGERVAVLRDCNSGSGVYLGSTRVGEVVLHSGLEVWLDSKGKARLTFDHVEILEIDAKTLWPRSTFGGMSGDGAARRELFHRADALARTWSLSSLVVQGGRGVGKKWIVREVAAIRRQPMTLINCSVLSPVPLPTAPEDHERPLAAIFEAHRGHVLYIERVEDLSRSRQQELVRILRARRTAAAPGDTTVFAFSFRQELWALLSDDTIDGELYAELARAELLSVPSLAECGPQEIAFLAQHFFEEYTREGPRSGTTKKHMPTALSAAAITLLQREAWPENVRQFRAVIHSSSNRVAQDRRIEPVLDVEDLQLHTRLADRFVRVLELSWPDAEVELCRIFMEEALVRSRGVIQKTAAHIGMERKALRGFLQKIGLHQGGDEGLTLLPPEPVATPFR